jgi:hypothetical protein
MNDGELAYSTRMQSLSGQGLALDPLAANALVHGNFFDIAAERNYTLMMASGPYKDRIDVFLKQRKAGDSPPISPISGEEFDRFSVIPVSYDSISETELYRIVRKP